MVHASCTTRASRASHARCCMNENWHIATPVSDHTGCPLLLVSVVCHQQQAAPQCDGTAARVPCQVNEAPAANTLPPSCFSEQMEGGLDISVTESITYQCLYGSRCYGCMVNWVLSETSGCSLRITTAQAHGRLLFKFASTEGGEIHNRVFIGVHPKTCWQP